MHALTIMFTDRGTPQGFRHMHGYSGNTYKWVNADGDVFFVKYTFKSDQGIKNFTLSEAREKGGQNAYYASQDLYESIEKKDFPSWTWYV